MSFAAVNLSNAFCCWFRSSEPIKQNAAMAAAFLVDDFYASA
jgi:hypothetical protein